ncbi:MAG: patatin-like phospholipase family protein [Xanthomonadales bacterium]|nr:patatin-like phospholipase family protein [Xanthomonadales bacterium]
MPHTSLSRRQFVAGISAATVTAVAPDSVLARSPDNSGSAAPRIGLALGSGGANGLAHVLILEALEEEGLRPHRIAGSSIGAVIGALYSGGMSTANIRKLIDDLFVSESDGPIESLLSDDAVGWTDLLEVELGSGGLLASERLVDRIYKAVDGNHFEQLDIPLTIVAADLWSREQVAIDSGELLPAVQASMAIPGVFRPVSHNNKVLVDGGTVNPVPFDLLTDDCDLIIAVDVTGSRTRPDNSIPGYFETLFNSVTIMQQAIVGEKLRRVQPDIFIAPEIVDIKSLEFFRAQEVYRQAKPAKQELKQQLRKLLQAAA